MLKTNKNCFSEHRTTVIFQFMMFYGLYSIYQGGGQDTPAGVSWGRGILAPTPYTRPKSGFFFFVFFFLLLITHKNCFSEHLTTVLPIFDVLMVITVYIWVGPKIPQPGYLAPPPPPPNLFQAKNCCCFLLKTHKNCFPEHLTTVIYQFMMF